jgi:succinate dehydrogenase/fumarate reductase-like Fe-S protein
MEGVIQISLRRENPPHGKSPYFQNYEIPAGRDMTVLEVLRDIYLRHDPTLAFRHYRCGRRLCRSCEVKVDGKIVRGCATLLHPGKAYRLEPANTAALIRDLVFDFDAAFPPKD